MRSSTVLENPTWGHVPTESLNCSGASDRPRLDRRLPARCIRWAQCWNASWNAFGSSASNTRRNVSALGAPFGIDRNVWKKLARCSANASVWAELIAAARCACDGDDGGAVRAPRTAIELAEHRSCSYAGRPPSSASAPSSARSRGQRVAGGSCLMSAQGVVDPWRMANVVAPGSEGARRRGGRWRTMRRRLRQREPVAARGESRPTTLNDRLAWLERTRDSFAGPLMGPEIIRENRERGSPRLDTPRDRRSTTTRHCASCENASWLACH